MQELVELSAEDQDLAMSRFHQLQPHLEQNRPLRVVAAEAGIPFRTAQRWVTQYPKRGLAALCFCQ
jgi:putative transposase